KFEPAPVVKPTVSPETIPLFVPDLKALERTDPPFSKVLEERASLRDHSGEAMTVEQLGEFLYRSARIKEQSSRVDVSFRPSPSAGALHPLEIYPVVDRCTGLSAGLYHYDPKGHLLSRISGPNEMVGTLLQLGGVTAMLSGLPQVLFVITARFQRVQNKYQSVAYSAILKDVGCLYQTMYLVATAMGLAPCALGGGHSDLFSQAAGLDYFAETSVGDFVLGTVGPGARDAARGEQWHAPTAPRTSP
ncbi:MAG: SagB family peptide dehydrogenase, partial [Deltaproteobacteria bacterium]|nr:SagB family peptide dehydrogenase [Deltaproteobacteria bacterium]